MRFGCLTSEIFLCRFCSKAAFSALSAKRDQRRRLRADDWDYALSGDRIAFLRMIRRRLFNRNSSESISRLKDASAMFRKQVVSGRGIRNQIMVEPIALIRDRK